MLGWLFALTHLRVGNLGELCGCHEPQFHLKFRLLEGVQHFWDQTFFQLLSMSLCTSKNSSVSLCFRSGRGEGKKQENVSMAF